MSFEQKIDKSAKALSVVFEENNLDKTGSNVLKVLSDLSSNSLKFKQFLSTQRIENKIKKEILSKVLVDIFNQDELQITYSLLEYIDFNYIESIYSKFNKIKKNSSDYVDVHAITANEMTSDELKNLKMNIESKINSTVLINSTIDKSLLGGIKLKVGNTLIDGSLSTKLEKLKQSMINK
tara:strand:- start:7480 stop:8019 length:540 start_codon:yes stop_codon:yes gene_type:complete